MGEIIENFRRIGSELNGVATQFNRRIFSRHFKQPLLFMSFPQKFWLDLNILTRCIHTRYVCFISLQMVVKIQCFVTLPRSQDGIMKNPTGLNNGRSLDSSVFGHPCPKPVRLVESRVSTIADRSLHPLALWFVWHLGSHREITPTLLSGARFHAPLHIFPHLLAQRGVLRAPRGQPPQDNSVGSGVVWVTGLFSLWLPPSCLLNFRIARLFQHLNMRCYLTKMCITGLGNSAQHPVSIWM